MEYGAQKRDTDEEDEVRFCFNAGLCDDFMCGSQWYLSGSKPPPRDTTYPENVLDRATTTPRSQPIAVVPEVYSAGVSDRHDDAPLKGGEIAMERMNVKERPLKAYDLWVIVSKDHVGYGKVVLRRVEGRSNDLVWTEPGHAGAEIMATNGVAVASIKALDAVRLIYQSQEPVRLTLRFRLGPEYKVRCSLRSSSRR